jgi:hypothetical protein
VQCYADKGYDANALRNAVIERKAWANIPPKANRKDSICFSKHLYKARIRRAVLQQDQALPPHRNALRQDRRKLSRRPQARRGPRLVRRTRLPSPACKRAGGKSSLTAVAMGNCLGGPA